MAGELTAIEPAALPPPRTRQSAGDGFWIPALRRSEWLLFAFFLYVPALGQWRSGRFPHPSALALLIPLTLLALARADSLSAGRVCSMVRDWVPAPLVLIAYWSVDWAPAPHKDRVLENALIGWDRTLLNEWGLREAIERFGALLLRCSSWHTCCFTPCFRCRSPISTSAARAGGWTISCSRFCLACS